MRCLYCSLWVLVLQSKWAIQCNKRTPPFRCIFFLSVLSSQVSSVGLLSSQDRYFTPGRMLQSNSAKVNIHIWEDLFNFIPFPSLFVNQHRRLPARTVWENNNHAFINATDSHKDFSRLFVTTTEGYLPRSYEWLQCLPLNRVIFLLLRRSCQFLPLNQVIFLRWFYQISHLFARASVDAGMGRPRW
jgi:hypothetical protein